MTLKQVLARGRQALDSTEDSALESEILLRHALTIDRAGLFADLERQLTPAQAETFWKMIERRRCGEPSAYITGHREFYGLDFYVNASVLIPRPETELLVEKAITLARQRPVQTIADVGTGSGAIAISLALSLPGVTVYATDISSEALAVAEVNRRKHGIAERVFLRHGDMLAALTEPVDVIVANLPYVRKVELSTASELSFEPVLALDGGLEGLDTITRLIGEAPYKLKPGGFMFLEFGQGQAEAVVRLLTTSFPSGRIEINRDLAGIERVAMLSLTPS